MAVTTATYARDGNRVPITTYGFKAQKVQTLTGNVATVSTALFGITGIVLVKALYGVVTTALGANVTTAFWRLNDQTATVAISLATGTTISAAPAESLILRRSLVTVALTLASAAAGAVTDPVAATAPDVYMPFIITQKTGAVATNIEFTYSTTDAPTSGVIQHNAFWLPISDDGALVAL